ncbi:MAG: hypothetical protein ABIL47_07930 [candidate division WOR-3 bacterium]
MKEALPNNSTLMCSTTRAKILSALFTFSKQPIGFVLLLTTRKVLSIGIVVLIR